MGSSTVWNPVGMYRDKLYVSIEWEKHRFKSKNITYACSVMQSEPVLIFLAIVSLRHPLINEARF
jgi:hypothetical protein